MGTTADAVFAFSMTEEGENTYDRDANDPGCWSSNQKGIGTLIGCKYGVSATDLIEYYSPVSVTPDTMENLSKEIAEAIFMSRYYNTLLGDQLPPGYAMMLVDFGYNAGVHTSARVLQRALRLSPKDCDGWLGQATLAALDAALRGPPAFDAKQGPDAIMALQTVLGVSADGVFGSVSARALADSADPTSLGLLAQIAGGQAANYRLDAGFSLYGNGWLGRTRRRAEAAMRMAIAPSAPTAAVKS